ncbi:MAG: hypothetical protein NT118_11655 [Lentisphaerae bacterium]|nr:hypothetical protein [Lentisphaerota bacterium]
MKIKITISFLVAVFAVSFGLELLAEPVSVSAYFKTPFQNESQFIVETIASDLAEQIFYAAFHRLPDKQHFSVTAIEKNGSSPDVPVYELQICLDPKQADLKLEISINGPIWSPSVYQVLTEKLALMTGLKVVSLGKSEDTTLLSKISDSTPESIEHENQELSAALEKDFGNPELHEKAALLLGAFLLREHSGRFFEIRSPLSRMTAHLSLARFLRGTGTYGINGQMAEAMLLTLINNQDLALERLKAVNPNDTAAAPVVHALRARNTGDYRPLDETKDRSRLESIEWFSAMANHVATPSAWMKLSNEQKKIIDFIRVTNQLDYSVEIGHQLLRVSILLELNEINSIYELSHHEKLMRLELVKVLNELPERCFRSESNGEVRVRVIGWGQWAMFFQRHLCHAVQKNFDFMNCKWSVPAEAKKFAIQCEREFGDLRLYPFVRRFNCIDVETYRKSVDDGLSVTVGTPHLVPSLCWNYLWYKVSFAPTYMSDTNLHIGDWHNRNPLPGTAYDLYPRLYRDSLSKNPDFVARLEQLHKLAPFDCLITNYLVKQKYNDHPTYDQAMDLYRAVLPYSVLSLRAVAKTVYDKPEQYEKLILQAAELNPACYYDLSSYALRQNQEDKAAKSEDKACSDC